MYELMGSDATRWQWNRSRHQMATLDLPLGGGDTEGEPPFCRGAQNSERDQVITDQDAAAGPDGRPNCFCFNLVPFIARFPSD